MSSKVIKRPCDKFMQVNDLFTTTRLARSALFYSKLQKARIPSTEYQNKSMGQSSSIDEVDFYVALLAHVQLAVDELSLIDLPDTYRPSPH